MSFVVQDLSSQEMSRLRVAASCLFGGQQINDKEFWHNLTPVTLKRAFREQVKRSHPDLYSQASPEMLRHKQDRFRRVQESYEVLKGFMDRRLKGVSPRNIIHKKIIAVGGAKGGIGKSMLACNLGVYLSSQGYQTLMVDLDLGGANLHLYLGETRLRASINDFLTGGVSALSDILMASKYGPALIGGDSSQLGSANISFTAKMRLLKSLRGLGADYVIIDLGSDTSFNILDFFLSADIQLILSTCEPASYLEAYNFIKVGLYRRLNRWAAEKDDLPRKNFALKELIFEATYPGNGRKVKNLQELKARVQQQHPEFFPYLQKTIESYQPALVINKVRPGEKVAPVVHRLQEVAGKMLGIQVRFLGAMSYAEEIHQSLQELTPLVAVNSKCQAAKELAAIMQNLL